MNRYLHTEEYYINLPDHQLSIKVHRQNAKKPGQWMSLRFLDNPEEMIQKYPGKEKCHPCKKTP